MEIAHPFWSARQRLARADTHITDCESRVREYSIPLDVDKYTIIRETDSDRCQVLHKIRINDPVRGALFGPVCDAISNLRASLDHAAFVVANSSATNIYFPISDSLDAWESIIGGKGRLKKAFPPDIVAAFRSLQPYKGGDGNMLWALNMVRKQSEHRSVIRLNARAEHDLVRISADVPGIWHFPYVESDEDSVPFLIVPKGPQPEYELKVTASVTFRNDTDAVSGAPLIQTLKVFSSAVSAAIDSIEMALNARVTA